MPKKQVTLEKATFAAGCFWCTEAIFKRIRGVKKVISGYAGGETENPTYENVHNKDTNHAESIQISFDPNKISYKDLLYIFWRTHDPTTLNKQGADVGTEYRSIIFYHNEKQKLLAEKTKRSAQKLYDNPIVTEIVPLKNFYEAEAYHQDFYKRNKSAPYCRIVIDPKIQKLQKNFKKYLKKEE
jgi:peptide-methionine (S)-S-oxide reductase